MMRRHAPRKTPIGLVLLLAAYVSLALAWNLTIPPYENLDEIEHTEVIRHIAVTGRLPIHGEAETAGYHVRQEASQPPLYHLLGAVWMRILGLPDAPPTRSAVPGAVVACGPSDTFYNKTTWARNPYEEEPPWQGHILAVHTLRLLSTLLQTFTVLGTWTLALRCGASRTLAYLATAIVAFNPQFLLISSGVNNDNLVTPLATWALVLLVNMIKGRPTARQMVGFGVLSGLAGLSKLSGLGLLGLGGIALLATARREHIPLRRVVGWGLLVGIPALLLLSPWIVRNLNLYGDPTALAPMLEKVGRREYPIDVIGEAWLMWRSYWGQIPCSFYPRSVYWVYDLLMVGGFSGLVVSWRKTSRNLRPLLWLLTGWFVLITVAWIRWNMTTPAPGGRLLFPAAPALAILLAFGWQQWLHKSFQQLWTCALPLWSIVALLAGPFAIFAPPRLLAENAPLPNPATYTFGEQIELVGYDVKVSDAPLWCWLVSERYCDTPILDISLFWKATAPITEDWVLALQLVSPQPGNDTLRFSYNRWPGHGNLPTQAWPEDAIIKDSYRLPLPDADFPTQAWNLQVAFFDLETHDRLPVSQTGLQTGTAAVLQQLRVPGRPAACEETHLRTPATRFGNAIDLTHARVISGTENWNVVLCWQSLTPVPIDYTVFVHAYAEDGSLIATGDGPPMSQEFPTSLWQPGDRIRDEHRFLSPQDDSIVKVTVGLYDPVSGVRLVAASDNTPQLNDAVTLWSSQPGAYGP
ncbi:MAG: glycosyltransferase family 39 protein [Anaerolineae bacterium]|nr:glycosyltransferase family 39 protein [Anaerolineae bacterium]